MASRYWTWYHTLWPLVVVLAELAGLVTFAVKFPLPLVPAVLIYGLLGFVTYKIVVRWMRRRAEAGKKP